MHGAEPRMFKTRLMARGFRQSEEIDFNEVFSPIVMYALIRIILALIVVQDMYLEQMDVKSTFLHGEMQEEITMQQPEGHVIPRRDDYVCLLRMTLYGL